jgi:hypothetical protein
LGDGSFLIYPYDNSKNEIAPVASVRILRVKSGAETLAQRLSGVVWANSVKRETSAMKRETNEK